MLKRRQAHPLLALLLALLLPMLSLGCVYVGNSAIVVGSLVPPSSVPGQTQEEELDWHAKAPAGNLAKRKRDRLIANRPASTPPVLIRDFNEESPRPWAQADAILVPDTLSNGTPLTRRGPPSA